ncbi:hypothetical protein N8975_04235 [Candidatus Pelagibacter ubique]|nr:hypothetical protein [Candidatus Pelagibacter ubique]
MKKIAIVLLVTFGLATIVSAEMGVKVGVSAQIGSMETSGKEANSDGVTATRTSKTEEALFGTAGFFIEKDLAFLPGPFGRLSVGFDNIAHDLDLGTQRNPRRESLGAAGAAVTATDHSLNAEVTGFETLYATLNVTDWLYLKAGSVTVDVETKFSGSATSSYPTSHSLDGTVMGFGVEKSSDNGMFFRLEYNDYSIDGKSVVNTGTDSKFTATLNDVSGSTGRISIGKAF